MSDMKPAALLAMVLMTASPAAAQIGTFPTIPVAPQHVGPERHRVVIPNRPVPVPVVLHLSLSGSDAGDGSAARPFATFERAQAAVRRLNRDHDVTVMVAAGTYNLAAPLRFGAEDGGQNGSTVRWEGEAGTYPLLSGGVPVTGWRLADAERGIWSAPVPQGTDPRQLTVDGRLVRRASVEIPRAAVEFHPWGLAIKDAAWSTLSELPDQDRIEVEGMSWFTHRHAMVERIERDRFIMQQPGWRNNLVGYDTFARPVAVEVARMFLVNSLAFLREPGQWHADPAAGILYYEPLPGQDMRS